MEKITYVLFALATALAVWIGGAYLTSPHLDDASLPRTAEA
jgi:hypothetical protein